MQKGLEVGGKNHQKNFLTLVEKAHRTNGQSKELRQDEGGAGGIGGGS